MDFFRKSTLVVAGLLASAVLASDSVAVPAKYLPSEQQVLTFIADTIDWYRHLPTAQRIGTEPGDLLFLEDNRPIATEIVRLSFEFGKAAAAIDTPQNDPDRPESAGSAAANSDLQYLIAAKAKLDADTQQAVDQLKSATQATLTARRADRKKRDTQNAEIRGRIQLLQEISGNYQKLLDVVRTACADPGRATNMTALVENLERTVPDISVATLPSQTSNIPADPPRAPRGIMGMISRVSDLGRKGRVIDRAITQTAALIESSQSVRAPFTDLLRQQLPAFTLDAASLDVLQQHQSRLADLVVKVKTGSSAMGALVKQQTLLNLYSSHLAEMRSEAQLEYRAAWKSLLVRLGVLGAVIAALLAIGAVVRRLALRHVHDLDTRRMFLVGQRALLWLIVAAVVLFAFAIDVNSLATFFGLVSAGLAIGLHDVFLAIGGYLLIVRRFHVRVGDRVQISGVSGEVTNLGLMQFELSEIDTTTGHRTGRVVFFANSYVFVSPATPLFRHVGAPA